MAHFGTETPEKLVELNNHLATNNYVNGDLPGADDVRIFESLKGIYFFILNKLKVFLKRLPTLKFTSGI
jgi:hypothetical protein